MFAVTLRRVLVQKSHHLKVPGQCSRPSPRALPAKPTLRLSDVITMDPLFLEKPNSFLLVGFAHTVCLIGCSLIPPCYFLLLWFREPSLTVAQPVLRSAL